MAVSLTQRPPLFFDPCLSIRKDLTRDVLTSTTELRIYSYDKLPPDLNFGCETAQYNPPSIFYQCNEHDKLDTIKTLRATPIPPHGIHIGFSTMCNYDIISTRTPKAAILCDINIAVLDFHKKMIEAILTSSNRQEFVSLILQIMEKDDFFPLEQNLDFISTMTQYFTDELHREGSWLSTDETFNRVKDLCKTGNVFLLPLDLTQDNKDFRRIDKWISKSGYELDTLYVSNIQYWVLGEKSSNLLDRYNENISTLIHKNTIVIDASEDLHQKCYIGCIPKSLGYPVWELSEEKIAPIRQIFRNELILKKILI